MLHIRGLLVYIQHCTLWYTKISVSHHTKKHIVNMTSTYIMKLAYIFILYYICNNQPVVKFLKILILIRRITHRIIHSRYDVYVYTVYKFNSQIIILYHQSRASKNILVYICTMSVFGSQNIIKHLANVNSTY